MLRTTWVLVALAAACGRDRPDAGPGEDGGEPRADAPAFVPDGTTPPPDDGGAPPGDAGACVPLAGTDVFERSCQQVALSVLEQDGAPTSLFVSGIVSSVGEPPCIAVDRVELRDVDSGMLVDSLEGATTQSGWFTARSDSAASELVAMCDSDLGRFDPLAVEVHGRTDGGTFVARCGAERFGSGWPPELVVTCHQNLPTGVTYMGSGWVMRSSSHTVAEVWFSYPNDAGLAIESISGDARVIPGTWGFGSVPIPPFDTTGWGASVSFPTSAATQVLVQLTQFMDPLGQEVCPVPPMMPAPGDPAPPVFLFRVNGLAAGRAFTSEALISYCQTIAIGGP